MADIDAIFDLNAKMGVFLGNINAIKTSETDITIERSKRPSGQNNALNIVDSENVGLTLDPNTKSLIVSKSTENCIAILEFYQR